MRARRITTIACLAGAFLAAGCEQVADTILTVKRTAAEYSEQAVRQSVEGARAYCGTVHEARRMEYRAVTDVAGKGPVVEVHCERF
ncbi:MAG: hypothetical protein GEU92_03870 [Alphaproteobacteria bacterium]|nr:hypothetical protein [Alphaproteobacteria bacterium]